MERPWVAAALALALVGCGQAERDRVDPRDYDSFWLWAGVAPPPELTKAKTLYLLDGELRANAAYLPLRPGIPRLPGKKLWLIVRTDTLAWPQPAMGALTSRLDRWAAASNQVEGLQIDFDARTKRLNDYAAFLRGVRTALPRQYKLSITGLLDGSTNGDRRVFGSLSGIVDEVVVQTYQGHTTIPGYEAYFVGAAHWPVPFRVGLVQNGYWNPPADLTSAPKFRGYVVFLVNPARRTNSDP